MIYILLLFITPLSVFSDSGWYKCLEGKIGDYEATFHLVRYGTNMSGYYYYNKYKQPIQIGGTVKDDSMFIYSYISVIDENFTGKFVNGLFTGRYKKENQNYINPDDKNKTISLRFELRENLIKSAYYNFLFVNVTEKLLNNVEASPSATYFEGFVFPSSSNPDHKKISEFILSEKNYPSVNTNDLENQMLSNGRKFFNDYINEHRDSPSAEILEYPSAYSREESDLLTVVYWDKNIFTFGRFSYGYYGGAHGNYATQYGVFDLAKGTKLTQSDVLNRSGRNKLPSLIEKYFRIQYGLKDNQSLTDAGLFENKIPATDNFLLTPGCIGFSYTPYEIGPYSMGEVLVYLPLYEIENYLTEEARRLLIN
jgi:hypothetical protein